MSLTIEEFANLVAQSGLMTLDELREFADALPEFPADGHSLARLLVDHGRLTTYQAQMLWSGKTDGLGAHRPAIHGAQGPAPPDSARSAPPPPMPPNSHHEVPPPGGGSFEPMDGFEPEDDFESMDGFEPLDDAELEVSIPRDEPVPPGPVPPAPIPMNPSASLPPPPPAAVTAQPGGFVPLEDSEPMPPVRRSEAPMPPNPFDPVPGPAAPAGPLVAPPAVAQAHPAGVTPSVPSPMTIPPAAQTDEGSKAFYKYHIGLLIVGLLLVPFALSGRGSAEKAQQAYRLLDRKWDEIKRRGTRRSQADPLGPADVHALIRRRPTYKKRYRGATIIETYVWGGLFREDRVYVAYREVQRFYSEGKDLEFAGVWLNHKPKVRVKGKRVMVR